MLIFLRVLCAIGSTTLDRSSSSKVLNHKAKDIDPFIHLGSSPAYHLHSSPAPAHIQIICPIIIISYDQSSKRLTHKLKCTQTVNPNFKYICMACRPSPLNP